MRVENTDQTVFYETECHLSNAILNGPGKNGSESVRKNGSH